MELDKIITGEIGDALFGPRTGEWDPVGVVLAIEEAGQNAQRHRVRPRLLLLDRRDRLLLAARQLLIGKGGIEDDVGEDRERLIEVLS